jgi:hypothetical protein
MSKLGKIFGAIDISSPVLASNFRFDEKPLGIWRAGYVQGEGGSAVTSSGFLVATDQRLIFILERGRLSKGFTFEHSVELDHITAYRLASMMQSKSLEVYVDDKVRPRLERYSNLSEVDPSSMKMGRTVSAEESREFFDRLLARH